MGLWWCWFKQEFIQDKDAMNGHGLTSKLAGGVVVGEVRTVPLSSFRVTRFGCSVAFSVWFELMHCLNRRVSFFLVVLV